MKKKLYKSTEHKLIAGVVSGLAEYFEFDVALARLLFVVALFVTGFVPGIFIYFVGAILIPQKPRIEPLDKTDYTVYQ